MAWPFGRSALILMIGVLAGAILHDPAMASGTQPGPCASVEARQFDFWVGEWDVYAKGAKVGFNHISVIQNGCTLLEEYHSLKGFYEGKSFNYYDPVEGHWHQVWVDIGGVRLHLTGGLEGAAMVMSGPRATAQGKVIDRITWTPGEDGTVRQVWDQSQDDGATFKTVFDGLYKPHEGD